MKYADIKTFTERCETHPDHQEGMISVNRLFARLHEEVDELRAYIEGKKWVGLTDEEVDDAAHYCVKSGQSVNAAIRTIEAKLKDKNT